MSIYMEIAELPTEKLTKADDRRKREGSFFCPSCGEKYIPTREKKKYLMMLFQTHKDDTENWGIHVSFLCPACRCLSQFSYATRDNPDEWIGSINLYRDTLEGNDPQQTDGNKEV